MTTSEHLDLVSPQSRANAYATYAGLRAEAPISKVRMPTGQDVWMITRYQECVDFLGDYHRFKTSPTVLPEGVEMPALPEAVLRLLGGSMGAIDPPEHTRQRRLVQSAFTPQYVERLRPAVQAIADSLVDGLLAADERTFDLVEQFAIPLPLTVMSDMLGIPREDRDRFRLWSELLLSLDPTSAQSAPQGMNPAEVMAEIEKFVGYLDALIQGKRANPGDDLISGMTAAEADGEKMTDDELLKMVALLVVGGLGTTQHLIGNMLLALFRSPDQLALLRENPDLAASAVEEMLRYHGSIEISFPRFAAEDTEIAGTPIRRGEMVIAVLAAADRDPERFPLPDKLDITRAQNRHLAFGRGAHMCLGAPLARVEGQVALNTLLARMPELRPAVDLDDVAWRPGLTLRGVVDLPVTY
ncbi:cytochrome P450 [Actinosynnema sp. NPDC047251]|uniref:Cytochrome P450 family protein n=1 Tax=Saccharothrix espanaensis (strain ATCC 51144 / DSM 44229 / JCM 9112 / NBRC 15066 / NRRL 15764) TaxID=1179773 RepID=K0K5P6_SACES|nr:cytochrome P450 [Saccharothrix espanaensis]CCH31888.1 Cytochrome P450 family protein [Saccharothrix espanaensis DSM 44229]